MNPLSVHVKLPFVGSYRNDIDKVIFSKCVQDGVDGVLGNGQFQAFHTSTDIYNNDDVLRWGGSLNVPANDNWKQSL